MKPLYSRAIRSAAFGTMVLTVLTFLPAGTVDYWQGWVFIATFFLSTLGVTLYLALNDEKLLERRIKAGPHAEREPRQKVIMFFATLGFISTVALPALDYRFGWSEVPTTVSLAADVCIALGFLGILFVFRANSYGASTIQVEDEQKVVTTGPYAIVRHPMYAAALPILASIPLALGSWWGLLVFVAFVPTLIWRLLDEERYLEKNLAGYTEYQQKVRSRLIPGVW